MKISIGADHRGFAIKQLLLPHLSDTQLFDVGTHDQERTDYPLFAKAVCQAIKAGTADMGILICGSGIGVSMAANRFKGIYAALCWNADVARAAKQDDRANVLVLPADFITVQEAFSIVDAWRQSVFKGGVYQKRLDMIDEF